MGNPVVHFELSSEGPEKLRDCYRGLFGWDFDTASPVAISVSEPGSYGFMTGDGGIPGGIGGGPGYPSHTIFYVGVDNVETALRDAERLGGTRVMGPDSNPNGLLVVAHFRDPDGNLIGRAGPS